jgi:hypothetical protein
LVTGKVTLILVLDGVIGLVTIQGQVTTLDRATIIQGQVTTLDRVIIIQGQVITLDRVTIQDGVHLMMTMA